MTKNEILDRITEISKKRCQSVIHLGGAANQQTKLVEERQQTVDAIRDQDVELQKLIRTLVETAA